MDCIISIELGTNAVRVYAFDLQGGTIGFAKGSYPTFHPSPDYSEQDPEQIFITMLYVLKNLLNEKVHSKNYKVLYICFSASMHSLLAVDKSGAPLTNLITWADNRGKKEAGTLQTSPESDEIYKATGTPIHPMSPLVKIVWLKNQRPDLFQKTDKFMSLKSYIIQQLTGRVILDHSLASATGLLNIYKKQWEPAALQYAGISASQLPEAVPINHCPGKLLNQYRVSLGVSASTKILAGSSDGCFATLGAGVWDRHKATITIEDSAAVRVIGNSVLCDKKRRLFNYVLDDTHYVSGGPSNSGGIVFEWFAKQFGDFRNAYDLETCMDDLIREASGAQPGAEKLLFLPYLLGERAPIWDAQARGVFFGVNINHERKHFARAVIEGILYEMYSIGKMLQEHRDIKELSINGSFASLPFCTQLIADIFHLPVSVGTNASSVSMGAYLLTATEIGMYKNIEEASRSVTLTETCKPNTHNNNIYTRYYSVFENLTGKLASDFEALANL
ncbi:MAG: gluconokinase [Bacteroidetes bacterium]|nr:gluconokinase [Bacteroidota bacterium]